MIPGGRCNDCRPATMDDNRVCEDIIHFHLFFFHVNSQPLSNECFASCSLNALAPRVIRCKKGIIPLNPSNSQFLQNMMETSFSDFCLHYNFLISEAAPQYETGLQKVIFTCNISFTKLSSPN